MEFVGQIKKILTPREGVSERTGNEWKIQPFIFEYFENPSDRYADSVLLETFNSEIIAQLKEYMKVRIGFGHKIREITRKDGTKTIINEVTLYKFELLDGAAQQPAQAAQKAAVDNQPANQPAEAQKAADGDQKDKDDDLPF
jgi:division protein CdvB (Snf7/Vps24/ESCRT-III family)